MTTLPEPLEALARAYDKEDAAQRGESDPWKDAEDDAEWVSERLACAQVAGAAYFAARSTVPEAGKAVVWLPDPIGVNEIWQTVYDSLDLSEDLRTECADEISRAIAKTFSSPASVPAPSGAGELCEDCPPVGYPTDTTRCLPCPRRATPQAVPAEDVAELPLSQMSARVALQEALKLCSLADTMTACRGDDDFIAGVRAKIEAALSTEPGEAEGWRDISTATKDGTFIIARAGRWLRPAVVHWATYDGVAKWGGDPEGFMEEDHFMQYWTEVRYEPIEWLPLEALDALPAAPLPEDTHHGR